MCTYFGVQEDAENTKSKYKKKKKNNIETPKTIYINIYYYYYFTTSQSNIAHISLFQTACRV